MDKEKNLPEIYMHLCGRFKKSNGMQTFILDFLYYVFIPYLRIYALCAVKRKNIRAFHYRAKCIGQKFCAFRFPEIIKRIIVGKYGGFHLSIQLQFQSFFL